MNDPRLNPEISRFCKVITEINDLSDQLKKAEKDFYDQGTPFEVMYKSYTDDLIVLQNEFLDLQYSISQSNGII